MSYFFQNKVQYANITDLDKSKYNIWPRFVLQFPFISTKKKTVSR